MSAYVIIDIHITDPVAYEGYKLGAAPTVSLYKGRYLARGGKVTILEGEPDPERMVILEFPGADDALAWWNSPEYLPFKQIRHAAAHCEMLLVEGV
jgi:uncharacterized protein (DUF1330 family)